MSLLNRPGLPHRFVALLLLAGMGLACTPALNWREVRPSQGPAQVMFPCKPTLERRTPVIDGVPTELTMYACEADGALYALAVAQANADLRAQVVAQALVDAQAQNFRARAQRSESPPAWRARPDGPQGHWVLTGARMPDGRAVAHRSAVWVQAGWVAQAIVMGASVPAEAYEVFVDGVRWRPAL